MLSTKMKSISFAVAILLAAAVLFVYPVLKSESAPPSIDNVQKEMEQVKAEMESGIASPATIKRYGLLAGILSKCNTVSQTTEPTIKAPFSPTASLCINGSIVPADPTFSRPTAMSSGNGMGPAGTCTLSASVPDFDSYSFNLTGCAAFPTVVNINICGPAGCTHAANLDTQITLYRNVAAGDPLTANGGLPAVFNAAAPCTNARAVNDESSAPSTSAGGSACDQRTPFTCPSPCPSGLSSTMRRSLGSGRFTVVLSGFSVSTTGNYNLYVEAAAAGCAVALAPTSGTGNISGRVVTSTGQGISKATITITGSEIAPMTIQTNGFGYYNFPELPVGGTYIVTVGSKTYTFTTPSQTVTLEDNVSGIDFVSEQ